jgi:flagellar biosynthesis GTPase FlhF
LVLDSIKIPHRYFQDFIRSCAESKTLSSLEIYSTTITDSECVFLLHAFSPFKLRKLVLVDCGLSNALFPSVCNFLKSCEATEVWKLSVFDLSRNFFDQSQLAEFHRLHQIHFSTVVPQQPEPETEAEESAPDEPAEEESEADIAEKPVPSQRPEEESKENVEEKEEEEEDSNAEDEPDPNRKEQVEEELEAIVAKESVEIPSGSEDLSISSDLLSHREEEDQQLLGNEEEEEHPDFGDGEDEPLRDVTLSDRQQNEPGEDDDARFDPGVSSADLP